MKSYPIIISGSRGKLESNERIRKELVRLGLDWDGIDFSGNVNKHKMKKLQAFANIEGLHFRISNSLGYRRADYRRRFFAAHPPDLCGRYICVYCGKWLKKEKTVVDHLYPIGKVSGDYKLQKQLKKAGINNVNDPKNLVASCHSCNERKADSMGLWLFRGKLGRFRYLLRTAVLVFAGIGIYVIVNHLL